MKIVVNACYGGFSLPEEFAKSIGLEYTFDGQIERTDPRLIEYVEKNPDDHGRYSNLVVEEIPDEATDFIIQEYDGSETILYVLDGKIRIA